MAIVLHRVRLYTLSTVPADRTKRRARSQRSMRCRIAHDKRIQGVKGTPHELNGNQIDINAHGCCCNLWSARGVCPENLYVADFFFRKVLDPATSSVEKMTMSAVSKRRDESSDGHI